MAYEIIGDIIFSFVTALREVLEAALIIGIVSSYISKVKRKDLLKEIWLGVITATVFSIAMAWFFLNMFSGLEEYQKLFESIIMFIAAGVLTWMVFWMSRQSKSIKSEMEEKIDQIITTQQKTGLFLLVFFSVVREGAELVLFLFANYTGNIEEAGIYIALGTTILGFTLGLILAVIMAYIIFKTTYMLDLKKFFQITSFILIIFAAGLLAHGIHEFYEFLEITNTDFARSFIWTELWNINDGILGNIFQFVFGWSYDPQYPLRFEKSVIGGIFAGLFGWNDNPALLEVLGYISYYLAILIILMKGNLRNPSTKTNEDSTLLQ
ncbi:MAG: hypothetical protein EAX86_06220 [Candidatus Heimdallarchaeota archaeon]|nr:hypothetical protein [Candidatus Heimdallarchaeota archaeon]